MADSLTHALMLKRRHPQMSHLWEAIECPYCHAAVGEPCQTKKGQRADMSHTGRIEAFDFARWPDVG